MPQIEIPQEYWEFLFLQCADAGMSPEEDVEQLINNYLERTDAHE